MKYVITLFLTAALFTSCSSSTKKTPSAISFSADSLVGNWIMVNLEVAGTREKNIQLMKSIVEPLRTNIELSTMTFAPEGEMLADDGTPALTISRWTLSFDTLRILHSYLGEDKPFIVVKLKPDSLVLQHLIGDGDDNLTIHYTLKKLVITDSTTIDIFEPLNNKWRIKPIEPENEEYMRHRLKQMLGYYSAYFSILQSNKIGYFNREKILLPLMFYDGGLGITPFEDAGNFPDLFFDEADAKKAHAILEKAFSNYEYPDLGNKFVQEYIVALKEISEKL